MLESCFKTELAGFDIELQQEGVDCFRVTYGEQSWWGRPYGEAAKLLGEAIMHAAACEGLLDNRTKQEAHLEREYDAYFTRCENANKTPLSFDDWAQARERA